MRPGMLVDVTHLLLSGPTKYTALPNKKFSDSQQAVNIRKFEESFLIY